MSERRPGRAPDFTKPALIMLGVNMTLVFFLLWAFFGLIPVLILGALIHYLIGRFETSRKACGNQSQTEA